MMDAFKAEKGRSCHSAVTSALVLVHWCGKAEVWENDELLRKIPLSSTAVLENATSALDTLIDFGADVNLYLPDGATALLRVLLTEDPDHWALKKVRYLIRKGADLNLRVQGVKQEFQHVEGINEFQKYKGMNACQIAEKRFVDEKGFGTSFWHLATGSLVNTIQNHAAHGHQKQNQNHKIQAGATKAAALTEQESKISFWKRIAKVDKNSKCRKLKEFKKVENNSNFWSPASIFGRFLFF